MIGTIHAAQDRDEKCKIYLKQLHDDVFCHLCHRYDINLHMQSLDSGTTSGVVEPTSDKELEPNNASITI